MGIFSKFFNKGGNGNIKIPAWNLSQSGNDFQSFVQFVRRSFWGMEYYNLQLLNVPIGNNYKPAFVLKVLDNDYRIWTTVANIQGMRFSHYIQNNYVFFAIETYFSAPEGNSIGLDMRPGRIVVTDNKNLNKLHFRQYFDPFDQSSFDILNSWHNLEGNDVIFFISDSNMNYLSGPTPNKNNVIKEFELAKSEQEKLTKNGNYKTAYELLLKNYPVKERYSIIK